MGFNTILVDLDLGAPNMHTCLGEPTPSRNFHEFITGKFDSLNDVILPTQIPKLQLITGSNDHTELANISVPDQSKLMAEIHKLNADFTILDLSAGTHATTLDFFNMAERHLVVLTPEPTSIENAYRFMKASFFRKIKRYEKQLGLEATVAEIMANSDDYKVKFPSDLVSALTELEPAKGMQLRHLMSSLDFDLILNQTRTSRDIPLGRSIESVCRRYFGLRTNFLGSLEYDNAVWHALRKRRPLLLEYPQSALYSEILAIARDLASPHLKKAVI